MPTSRPGPVSRYCGPKRPHDHDLAFSYYFQDPDGNHLELTTYDHDSGATTG